MRKLLVFATLMGMAYLLAITPSMWKLVTYAIPILSLCLLVTIVCRVVSAMKE